MPSIGQVRQGWKTEQKLKQPAWEEFLAVCRVLRRYDALKDEDVPVRLRRVHTHTHDRILLWLLLAVVVAVVVVTDIWKSLDFVFAAVVFLIFFARGYIILCGRYIPKIRCFFLRSSSSSSSRSGADI